MSTPFDCNMATKNLISTSSTNNGLCNLSILDGLKE